MKTSSTGKGGVVSYAKIKPQLNRKCFEERSAIVTTMFDLYGLPNDFPVSNSLPKTSDPFQKAEYLEQEMGVDDIFGVKTEEAVRDFQSEQKLTSNGIVESLTWNALSKFDAHASGCNINSFAGYRRYARLNTIGSLLGMSNNISPSSIFIAISHQDILFGNINSMI